MTDVNLEGAFGVDLPSMKAFAVTQIDKVYLYSSESFQRIGELPIALLKTETREPNQIISIRKSQDDNYVACISGKNLIMKQQKANQLFVFKREKKEMIENEAEQYEFK